MIEIHLDGKPVTKLQAAQSVANLDGESWRVDIGEPGEDGQISARAVTVYAACCRGQGRRPGEVSWPSVGCLPAADARAVAAAITLGAEIAELAEMIAAEQVTEFRTSSTGVMARCRRPGDHGPALEGATLDCDVAAHHQPPLCEYCDVEPAAEGKYCAECAPAVRLASGAA